MNFLSKIFDPKNKIKIIIASNVALSLLWIDATQRRLFSATTSILFCFFLFLLNFVCYLTKKTSNSQAKPQTGLGYDVHKLEDDAPLVLCSVPIKHTKGLISVSDGDVATHALIDALLGAANLGDIGTHFPNDDPKFKGISSFSLLQQTITLLEHNNYKLLNVDLTIVAQKPTLKPFIPTMKTNLSSAINLSTSNISIKATTEDGLGFTGSELGIKAFCIATIEQISNNDC